VPYRKISCFLKRNFSDKTLIPFIGVRLFATAVASTRKNLGQPPMGPGTVPVLLASSLKLLPFGIEGDFAV
jgi:hypothetical protein